MTKKTKFSHKLLSIFLTIALIMTVVPLSIITAGAAEASDRVADPSTINQWQNYFPISGDLNTKNAGGVWTDKSVFTEGTNIDGKPFSLNDENNYLVALSAIGSNMSVTGQAAAPTDTILVLDMSSSMSGNVGSLATATNAAIKALYAANPNNRVAVVTYSANSSSATKTFLPLDSYTATGNFLTSRDDTLSVASGVKNSNGNTVSGSVSLSRGTYIQGGIAEAIKVLDARTETEGRIPVVVLMTDGEPTIGSTNYVSPDGNMAFGVNGVYGGDDYAFATQLSLAYMKEVAYPDMLLYTIGVGVDDSDSVLDILNPTATLRTANIRNYWTTFKNASVGSNVTIKGRRFAKNHELNYDYVSKIDNGTEKVNGYFSASSKNLSSELSAAFESVVAEIVKSSVYSPTLIESAGRELSGYVSFVDKIGSYMKVSELKGIMSGGTLFTGEKIAKAFYEAYQGNTGGDLGSMADPSSIGYAFMRSIESRLNINNDQAWELMINSWRSGQIFYNESTGEYGNWVGWVSSASGAYLQPYNETDNGLNDFHILPANAAYINRSFIFLGAEGDTNMMYTTVRIREKVVNGVPTGEQEINFALPASLLPVITYEVTLDENSKLENIGVIADTPIHLIYEVGLDPEINKFNVKDKVSAEYLAANTDKNTGEVYFYTNEWEREADADGKLTGYYKSNTYSYFRPSQKNDRYYYQSDSLVYSDTSGTVYKGTDHPKYTNGSYYYYYNYYERVGNSYKTVGEYHIIPKDVLSVAQSNGSNGWIVYAGTIRSDYSGNSANVISKANNPTETLNFSHEPFADSNSYAWDDATHSSVVGVTMANNGRLALAPETGIRLTKTLAADAMPNDGEAPEFTFEISYSNISADLEAYAYRYVNGVLQGSEEAVVFANGKATVTIKAGETLYIGGMTSGNVTVTEQSTLKYVTQTVSVNGNPQAGDSAEASLTAGDMIDIDFINTLRGTGSFTVAKEITHDFGANYAVPENENTTFKVNLTFTFNGKPLSGEYTVIHTDGNETGIKLNGIENETVTVYLNNTDQYSVFGLPEGTVVKAVEELTTSQESFFTASYWENVNEVTVKTNAVAQVLILNDYTAQSVTPNLAVSGTKTLTGNTYSGDFIFKLQKYNGSGDYNADSSWTELDSATVTYENSTNGKAFAFDYDWSNEVYTEIGSYIYRIYELKPAKDGVIYDSRIHTFQINVTDTDMDGKLEISSVTTTSAPQVSVTAEGNNWNVKADFENQFTNASVVSISIDVQKAIENNSQSPLGENLAGFEFGLYDADENLVGTTIKTNSLGAVRFNKTFTADEVGTHVYTLKEIAPNQVPAGWTYTNKEVKITVVVSQAAGENHLNAVITTNDSSAAVNAASNNVAVTFTNTYTPKSAELNVDFVSKQISSNMGLRELKDGEFSFAIYEVVNGVRAESPVATGTNNAEGAVTFNKTFTYDKVGGPYFYDIVEIKPQNAPSYITYDASVYKMTVTVTDAGGSLKATPVVESVAGNQVVFENHYTAAPATLTIEGNKTLTGRVIYENDFQFILAQDGTNNTWYAVNSTSGTNESAFAFPQLTYTEQGTFTYKVSEYDPTKASSGYYDGVSYDSTVYTVVVTVKDNQNGQLEATYTVDGSATKKIAFENAYNPAPVNVSINGTKILSGRNILETDSFTFNLYAATVNQTTYAWTKNGQVKDTAKAAINGRFTFEIENITEAGRYYYIIDEVQGNAGGIGYDQAEWRVLVSVSDDGNGKLNANVYYLNDSGRQDAMVFTNTYSVSNGSVTVEGKKQLENKAITNEQFTFNIYETDENFVIGETQQAAATFKNDGLGNLSYRFDFTAEDIGNIYYYVIKEQNSGKIINGIKYSDNEYHITITVEDGLDGTLKLTKEIKLGDSVKTAIDFTNSYTTQPTTAVIEGTKTLTGRKLTADDKFEFELYKATANGEAAQLNWTKNGLLQTVSNNADGIIKFNAIENIEAGKSYCFIVTENKGADNIGIEYDLKERYVLINGKDNGDGTVTAEITYYDSSKAAKPMVFENKYTVKNGSVIIEGTKELEGRKLKDGEFSFELYKAETNDFVIAAGQKAYKTASNNAQKEFAFELEYSMADIGKTYYYVVKEANNGKYGVSYSQAEYKITVNVADNGDGSLKLTKGITLGDKLVENLLFTNIYQSSTEVNVYINKKVENKGSESITPEGFEFLLEREGSQNGIKVTSDALGNAEITLGFTEADIGNTYAYKLSEVAGDMDNVTYSTVEYVFTIEIDTNENDELVASVILGDQLVEAVEAEFVNIYDYTPPQDNVPNIPQTGDTSNVYLWFALLFVSSGGILGIASKSKKRKTN